MSKIFKERNPGEDERDVSLDDDDAPGSFDDDEPPLWDDVAVPAIDDDEPAERSPWHDVAAPPAEPDEPDEPSLAHPSTGPDEPSLAHPSTGPDEPSLAHPSSEPDAHALDVRPRDDEVAVPIDADAVDVRSLDVPSLAPTELFATDPEPEVPETRPVAPPLELQIATLLADPHKRIVGDIQWSADEDGAQGREFLAPVRCAGAELRVRGQICAAAGTLRFSLLLRGVGRVAALDIGHAHQAADGQRCGETHFHRRDHPARELEPLAPDDLAGAWRRFCALTSITHEGALDRPRPTQETLL